MNSIKLVCFDLDNTLITQNSWMVLNSALGITKEEDARLYNEYTHDTLSYDDWMKALLLHYKKSESATQSTITKVLTNYSFVSGAKECIEDLKIRGYDLALISGGIDIVVKHVAETLGITHSFASNTLVFDANNRISDINHSGDEDKAKFNFLRALLEKLSLQPEECVCVADGANDLAMFRLTGHGITFKGSPIEKEAWKIVSSLVEIPALLD